MFNSDAIVEWIESRFEEVKIDRDEVKIHDPWWLNEYGEKDHDHKCWINITKGCYHALKSGKKGGILHLITQIDHCSYQEARQILKYEDSPYDYEAMLDQMFQAEAQQISNVVQSVSQTISLTLPDNTISLRNAANALPGSAQAISYLQQRKIPTDDLYYCYYGTYKNRIIIPYYNKNHNLIYWNARDITGKDKIKSKGPDRDDCGIGKSDVLWMRNWNASKIYLTEGEFDAISLCTSGLDGAACGSKNVSDKQIELLRPYRVCFCFDNDRAGNQWIEVAERMLGVGIRDISFVRPPQQYKDWNALLIATTPDVISFYINSQEKPVNEDLINNIRMNQICN